MAKSSFSGFSWFTRFVVGTAHHDILYGNDFASDRMYGGAGDDVFHSSGGRDYFNGGTGFDTVNYSGSSSGVDVRLYNGRGIGGDAQGDTYFGIEGLVGSSHGDNLHGSSANNTLDGGGGNDYLYGYSGNDTFIGGSGSDYMNGGTGHDIVDYSQSNGTVNLNLNTGEGYGDGDSQGDRYTQIEEVIGSAYRDFLWGDTSDNILRGGDGNDDISGWAGTNLLFGGEGDDHFYGNIFPGNGAQNTMDGGIGVDTIYYRAQSVNVNFETGIGSDGANGDTYINIENARGTIYDDYFTGKDGVNNLLNGNDGNDTFYTSTGENFYYGGRGLDKVDYSGSSSAVDIRLYNNNGYGGDAQGDSYNGIENLVGSNFDDRLRGNLAENTLEGGDGNDYLHGYSGRDTIIGGASNDVLVGGLGDDNLWGGENRDTFIFADGDGNDIIHDFSGGKNGGDRDRIDLSDFDIISWQDLRYGGNQGMREVERGTEIYNSQGDTILLEDVDIDDLGSGDFIFNSF